MVIKHICKHYNTTTTDKPVFRGKIWDRVKVIDNLFKRFNSYKIFYYRTRTK